MASGIGSNCHNYTSVPDGLPACPRREEHARGESKSKTDGAHCVGLRGCVRAAHRVDTYRHPKVSRRGGEGVASYGQAARRLASPKGQTERRSMESAKS